MNNRYLVAKAKGASHLDRVISEDAELLSRFGLRLLSVEQGITVVVEEELRGGKIHPWNCRRMTAQVWDFVRPLLVRLKEAEEVLGAPRAQTEAILKLAQ